MKRYWVLALALVVAACGGGGQKANFTDPTDRLEVVSWWVSPSEHPAFEVLLNAFKADNPKVEVIDGSIAGGGGSNVQVALAARLRAGDPPDVWQTFLGSSLRAWVDAGRIADVSAVYERTGLDQTMPATLLDAATYRVKAWGVPTGSHRGNNLWFNLRVLHDAGIAVPAAGYTSENFASDLAKVAASGRTRCAWAVKIASLPPSCSKTPCSASSAPMAGPRFVTTQFDWTRTSTQKRADPIRRRRVPRRSKCRCPDMGSSSEEVGVG